MNQQEWTEIIRQSFVVLDGLLAAKGCKIAQTTGNHFRIIEGVLDKPYAGRQDQRPTDSKIIGDLFYKFVAADVTRVVDQGLKQGEIHWDVPPAKLVSHLKQLGLAAVPESQRKNSLASKPRTAPITLTEIEDYVRGIPHFDPRHAIIHNFTSRQKERGMSKDSILKLVWEFVNIRDLSKAREFLKMYEDDSNRGLMP